MDTLQNTSVDDPRQGDLRDAETLMLMNVLKEESRQRSLGSINNMVKSLLTADMMGNPVIV